MSNNQTQINSSPSFIQWLLDKKRREQQGWSENLPSGESVGDAVGRISPSIFNRTRLPDTPPVITRNIQQTDELPTPPTPNISTSLITTRVPDQQPVPVEPKYSYDPRGFDSTQAGMNNIQRPAIIQQSPIANALPDSSLQISRPRMVNPTSNIIEASRSAEPIANAPDVRNIPPEKVQSAIAPLINRYQNAEVSTPTDVSDNQPIQRPYMANEHGDVLLSPPESMLDQTNDARPRITNPSQFLINRYMGSLTDQPDYGVDKNGVPRTHAKRGIWGRVESGGKRFFRGLGRGEGLVGATEDFAEGAANPDKNAQDRLARTQGKNFQAVANQLGLEGEQAKLQDMGAQIALRNAQTQRTLNPPAPKPIYRTDAQGRIVKITPGSNGEADKSEVVVNTQKTHAPHTQWADGKLLVQNPQTGTWDAATDKNGKEITDQLRTPAQIELDGDTYTVSPNTAAEVRATGERFKITSQNEAARFNAERAEKRATWNKSRQEILNTNSQVETDLAQYQKDLDKEQDTAQNDASPSARAKASQNAASIREKMVRRGAERKPDPGEFPETAYTPQVPKVSSPRPQGRSNAPSGGKYYTRAQVKAYADKAFNGDYNKAAANVQAEGFTIQ